MTRLWRALTAPATDRMRDGLVPGLGYLAAFVLLPLLGAALLGGRP